MKNMQILNDLSRMDDNLHIIIYCRHAERPELPPDETHCDIPITDAGRAAALQLGSSLPHDKRLFLRHTGVARTIQTAEAIAEGFSKITRSIIDIKVIQSQYGSYVHSSEIFRIGWQHDFVANWLNGSVAPEIIDHPTMAARRILGTLLDSARSNCPVYAPGTLYVHIGHDWDIYLLQHILLGLMPESNPVGFLEGIILGIGMENHFVACRNGHWVETSISNIVGPSMQS
jgi:broad specificity phosphatase PhoE